VHILILKELYKNYVKHFISKSYIQHKYSKSAEITRLYRGSYYMQLLFLYVVQNFVCLCKIKHYSNNDFNMMNIIQAFSMQWCFFRQCLAHFTWNSYIVFCARSLDLCTFMDIWYNMLLFHMASWYHIAFLPITGTRFATIVDYSAIRHIDFYKQVPIIPGAILVTCQP